MPRSKNAERVPCRHCGRNGSAGRVRGLCGSCHDQKDIRALYPDGRTLRRDEDVDEDELEAMIAEQMKPENLPKWWDEDVERQKREGVAEARAEFGRLIWGKRA